MKKKKRNKTEEITRRPRGLWQGDRLWKTKSGEQTTNRGRKTTLGGKGGTRIGKK